MPSIRYFSVFFLCLRLVAAGQTDRSLDQLSSAERTFLDLILRDTISSTICRLPKGMNFGIQNPDTGRLVLVKEGRTNQLLLEGTNRVYVPDTTRKKGLTRIDSTFYTGDNFNFMAFRRRDTLFQFGGYGFWDTRDFFTWYRPWNHEWEIKVQTDYLQHQWTAYQYDRESDALYVMGRRFRGPFDDADQYIDSVYQFDFHRNKWINLGRISPELPWRVRPVNTSDLIAHTPLGLLLRSEDNFILADIVHNEYRSCSDDLSKKMSGRFSPDTSDHKEKTIFIYLSDSLYLIEDRSGKSYVQGITLRLQDFVPAKSPSRMYASEGSGRTSIMIIAGAIIVLVMVGIKLKKRTKKDSLDKNYDNDSLVGSMTVEPMTKNDSKGSVSIEQLTQSKGHTEHFGNDTLNDFLSHLNEVERTLVTAIVRSTIDEQKMDIQRINEIIGVSQKPMAIQKARRSLVIHQINRTFALTTGCSTELIRKERDLFEKRTYVYSADLDSAFELKKLMP